MIEVGCFVFITTLNSGLLEGVNARASLVEALVKKNQLAEALVKALEDPPVAASKARRDIKVTRKV